MARELVVWCKTAAGDGVYRYFLAEAADGQLRWRYGGRVGTTFEDSPPDPPEGATIHDRLKNSGRMCGALVEGDEAEILTGLHMPAAMDRLRELLHECPVFAAEGAL